MKKMFTLFFAALVAASVATPAQAFDFSSKEGWGKVIGGLLGGAAGNQIGGGDGKVIATIAGTIAGTMIGGSVGASLDRADRAYAAQVLQQGLQDTRAGVRRASWTGGQGQQVQQVVELEPVRATSFTDPATGQQARGLCKPYTHTIQVQGVGEQQASGLACQKTDGTWEVVASR